MTTSTYEMLWDCKFCGSKKLLGLTHRHCPSCGAPQNAEERYFPSDAEKVPAEEHVYYGADVVCAHCGQANGKNSKHCGGCGAALEGTKEVGRRADQVAAAGAAFTGQSIADARRERQPVAPPAVAKGPAKSRARSFAIGCLSIVVLSIAALVVALTWKKSGSFVVTGHTWQRRIAIERFGPVSDSAWCDSVPYGARNVSRHREVRSTRRVPDGENCSTRRVDNGNGTFSEHQECTTRYRDEDVYDDRCSFTIDRWAKARDATASGTSSDAPRWPASNLSRTGSCVGCEREANRTESYTVRFADPAAGEQSCDFDEARWRSMTDGSRWKGQIRVVGNSLDCGSLTAE